nr:hypothetical protein [Desulfomarina profundi]
MKFRPCIDLHEGKVKQIVGSTLNDDQPDGLTTNFTAKQSPAWFAKLYQRDSLRGGILSSWAREMTMPLVRHFQHGLVECR